MPSRDFTNVTLVSEDTFQRLEDEDCVDDDKGGSPKEETVFFGNFFDEIPFFSEDVPKWKN